MMDFFRKYKVVIYTVTIAGFLGGIIFAFGGYLFGPLKTHNAVATVNGKEIPYEKFRRYLNQALDSLREKETEITPEITQQYKNEILQQLIQTEIFYQEAQKHGIKVTDRELLSRIQQIPVFQSDGVFNRELYIKALIVRLKTTPEEFEEEQRREMAGYKLRRFFSLNFSIPDDEINLEYSKKYSNLKSLFSELDKITVTDDELKEAYKKQHDGKLDGFAANKNSFKSDYKANKHKSDFAEQYRSKFLNQYLNDWYQKTVQESKIKIHLDEIEKQQNQAV